MRGDGGTDSRKEEAISVSSSLLNRDRHSSSSASSSSSSSSSSSYTSAWRAATDNDRAGYAGLNGPFQLANSGFGNPDPPRNYSGAATSGSMSHHLHHPPFHPHHHHPHHHHFGLYDGIGKRKRESEGRGLSSALSSFPSSLPSSLHSSSAFSSSSISSSSFSSSALSSHPIHLESTIAPPSLLPPSTTPPTMPSADLIDRAAKEAARRLLRLAEDNGSLDDVTVIVTIFGWHD